MSDRNSRKRNVPARLREETWYLVCYEDDNNLRVLGRVEIRHIFPHDDDDAINVGDIVSAIWIPNGQFYDAKILQKGADRNELMKERVHLEKAAKNNAKEDSRAQQKRKDPEDSTDGQKKKKQADSAQEKEKNAKERGEKRKKKEQDQERQKHILEARKAQAAARLATSCNNNLTIFTPQPILQPSTTSSSNSQSHNSNHTRPPLSCQTSQQRTPPAHPTFHVPSPDSDQNVNSRQNSPHSTDKTPLRPNKSATPSQPRRGLHFQSAIEDFTDDEVSDEGEESLEGSVSTSNSSNWNEDHKREVEALRKRLEKVHKRLNIALKAKTSGEVVKSRPGADIVYETLAAEYKMVEVMEGTGVYWYPHQRAYCAACKNWAGYINAAIDIFFTKEILAVSCAKGNEKKGKNGHQPLDPLVIDALIGKVCSKFSKDSPVPSQVVQKINMKCVEARRPQRIRIARRE
ncbi:DNA ligase 1-like [Montipora capricornis]|uniref:DNA ligase 1-like n=1 Tax=Montipora capricornis TaxID=246305 RepID=UPI0035F15591